MSALTDLQAQVAQTQAGEQSAVVAFQGIAKQLQAALDNNDTAAFLSQAELLSLANYASVSAVVVVPGTLAAADAAVAVPPTATDTPPAAPAGQ